MTMENIQQAYGENIQPFLNGSITLILRNNLPELWHDSQFAGVAQNCPN